LAGGKSLHVSEKKTYAGKSHPSVAGRYSIELRKGKNYGPTKRPFRMPATGIWGKEKPFRKEKGQR